MSDEALPPLSLDELVIYFQGVVEASVMLKGRLSKSGPEQRAAVREVGRFQAMVKSYLDALQETKRLRAAEAVASSANE